MPPKSTKSATQSSKPAQRTKRVKAAKPVEEQVKRHFGSLAAQIEGAHFKNGIKTCHKILKLVPDDADALDSKLFLFIQTEQYEGALELIDKSIAKNGSHALERAYLLYRLNKEKEALKVVETARKTSPDGADNRALMHLEAQIKYRETDYDAARQIYYSLLDTCPEDTEEHPDLVTNLNATQAHLDFLSSGYLTAINSLDISVPALEDAGVPPLPSTSSAQPKAGTVESAPDPAPTKPPRKARLPKHVILGSTPLPDPERWLRKRERTHLYGRGGRRRAPRRGKEGMGLGATQGVALPVERPTSSAGTHTGAATGSGSRPSAGKKSKKGR